MIHFHRPYVIYDSDKAILKCDVQIDDFSDTICFWVDKEYGEYLCYERADAYVIAVLNYAMRNHHDIKCDAPLSEELYYNIDKYLIDALVRYNPSWYRLKITAEIANESLPCYGAVGTGVSCGLDSFHVLASQTAQKFHRHNVTHLAFNNVGSHGNGERAFRLYNLRKKRPQEFANHYGFEFVANDSNVHEVIKQMHFKTHTYSSVFAVYCLQKLYSVYYYASGGYKYNEIQLEDKDGLCCGAYDVISLPLLSTRNLKIYSDGIDLSRLEKLRIVSKYQPSYAYLNVCIEENENCGICEKCIRTLLGLDSIGALKLYEKVFDVDSFYKNKKWYLVKMLKYLADGKHDYYELYQFYKKDVTIWMRMQVIPYKIELFFRSIIPRDSKLFKVLKKFKDRRN